MTIVYRDKAIRGIAPFVATTSGLPVRTKPPVRRTLRVK
jgi:hypothetical protein